MGDLEDILVTFDRIARDIGFEYAIVGGIALLYHGVPRATMDVDCLIKAEEGQLISLARALEGAGFFVDIDDLLAMDRGEGHASIEHRETMFRLDVFPARDELGMITLRESIEVSLGVGTIRIASPETNIVSKLRFGSPQDIKDAEGVYGRMRDDLDTDKLKRYAELVGVEEELASLIRRVDRLLDQS